MLRICVITMRYIAFFFSHAQGATCSYFSCIFPATKLSTVNTFYAANSFLGRGTHRMRTYVHLPSWRCVRFFLNVTHPLFKYVRAYTCLAFSYPPQWTKNEGICNMHSEMNHPVRTLVVKHDIYFSLCNTTRVSKIFFIGCVHCGLQQTITIGHCLFIICTIQSNNSLEPFL